MHTLVLKVLEVPLLASHEAQVQYTPRHPDLQLTWTDTAPLASISRDQSANEPYTRKTFVNIIVQVAKYTIKWQLSSFKDKQEVHLFEGKNMYSGFHR
jgi:hypothetical protein